MADKIIIEADLEISNKSKQEAISDSERLGRRSGEEFSGGFQKGLSALNVAVGATIANFAIRAIDGIANAARQGVQDLRDFSKGVAEINSILPANEKLTRASTEALISFSSQFATGPTEQARGFYNIVSAGVKGTANQLQTLKVANTAAVAGLVDIDRSAKVLVSSVNAYSQSGLTAKEASDSLFIAVREGQTTFSELADFLGNVTGVAASAGLQFNELTGSIAAFTKQGLSTDIAVTGLRQVLVSVIKPTKEAADEAKRLGIDFSTAGLKAKGFADFVKEIADRTGGSSESISKLFGNVRALTPILTTVNGNFAEFKRILEETKNSAGATAEAFNIIAQSFDFQLKQRGQELRNFFLQIGLSAERTFGTAILGALPKIDTLKSSFIALGRAINVAVIFPLEKLFNIGKIVFNGMTLQIQIVVAAIAQIGKGLAAIANFLGVDNELTRGLQAFAESSLEVAQEFAANFSNSIKEGLSGTVFDTTGKFLDDFENNLVQANEIAAANPINIPGITPTEGEGEGGESGIAQKTTEINALTTAFQGLGEGFTTTAESSDQALDKLAKKAVQAGKQMRAGLANGISQGFAAFGAAIAKGENALDAFVKSFLSSLGQMAIQQGAFFILEGLGLQFVPGLQAQGAALIGIGAAMSALGGVLTAIGGGQQGTAAAGVPTSGGGVGAVGADPFSTSQDEDREDRPPEVSLTIQGNVLDSQESGLQIVKILNDAFETQGAVLRGVRTV